MQAQFDADFGSQSASSCANKAFHSSGGGSAKGKKSKSTKGQDDEANVMDLLGDVPFKPMKETPRAPVDTRLLVPADMAFLAV